MVLRAIGSVQAPYTCNIQSRSVSIYSSLYANVILNRFNVVSRRNSVPFFLFWRGFDLISRNHERLTERKTRRIFSKIASECSLRPACDNQSMQISATLRVDKMNILQVLHIDSIHSTGTRRTEINREGKMENLWRTIDKTGSKASSSPPRNKLAV